MRLLRKIADQIGAFTRGFDYDSPDAIAGLINTLERYAVLSATRRLIPIP